MAKPQAACEITSMSWLVDNANLIYLFLGIVLLGLGVRWWLHRRVKTLFLAAGVVCLIVLFWLFTLLIPTDRKQIQDNLWAMAKAVLDKDPDALAQHWAKDFSFKGLGRNELAQAVVRAATQFQVESINLWEFDVKELEETKAKIWFRCVANAKGGEKFLALAKADFVKEGDEWRLQRIALFQPIANTDQEIPLPIGR
jgi:hypothetical protein